MERDINSGGSDWTMAAIPASSAGVTEAHCCPVAVEHKHLAGAALHDDERSFFCTATMAILRQLVVGVAASRPLAARLATSRPSVLTASRLLSTNSRQQAQHTDHTNTMHPNHPRSPSLQTTFPGEYKDPYAGGPSAIEKAVHLFFFTEILRGARKQWKLTFTRMSN